MTLLATDPEVAPSLTQLASEPSVTPAGPERSLPAPPLPALPRAVVAPVTVPTRLGRQLRRLPDLLAAVPGRLRPLAVALWATARVTALLLARLVGWFAADRRRRRTAALGLATATAVGLTIGLVVGAVLTLGWEVVRGLVVDELVGT